VSVRRIVEIAVRYTTTDVIVAHNHPGGVAVPSEEDICVTGKVAKALSTVGIRLCDHLIIAGNDWVSLASTPTLAAIFAGP
jgi:DNA repair protein RadC